jgi:hypothetical protein
LAALTPRRLRKSLYAKGDAYNCPYATFSAAGKEELAPGKIWAFQRSMMLEARIILSEATSHRSRGGLNLTGPTDPKPTGPIAANEVVSGRFFHPEEALAYLGVSQRDFDVLVKQYGIGRYHLPEEGNQVFYAREDLEAIKASRPAE